MKRTKDWANRAQQAADQMDESYRQHHEGLRASHAQPGLFEGLIADSQAAFERSQALENALPRSYGFASYYAARAQLRRAGRVRGPDGVVVAIRCVNVGKVRADRPAPPARWPRSRIKRLVAMVGYYATLAPKLRKSHYVWGTYASTQSGPLVEVARRFPRRRSPPSSRSPATSSRAGRSRPPACSPIRSGLHERCLVIGIVHEMEVIVG